jgi:dGTPase
MKPRVGFFGVLVEDDHRDGGKPAVLVSRDVRAAGRMMVHSPVVNPEAPSAFLFERMYRAPAVVETQAGHAGRRRSVPAWFMTHTDDLPKQWQQGCGGRRRAR